jgi:hypothetical protein
VCNDNDDDDDYDDDSVSETNRAAVSLLEGDIDAFSGGYPS